MNAVKQTESPNIGEWVRHIDIGIAGKLVQLQGDCATFESLLGFEMVNSYHPPENFVKASPEDIAAAEERQKWAQFKRMPGTFESGDVVTIKDVVYRVHSYDEPGSNDSISTTDAWEAYKNGYVQSIHPKEYGVLL